MRMFCRRLFPVLVIVMLTVFLSSGDGKKVKRKALDDASVPCKTCKRILMSIESTVLPDLRKAKLQEKKTRNLDAGQVEEQVLEKMTEMCTFSNVYYQKDIRKECERIIEEHEQEFAKKIVEWGRAAESFNLVQGLCHGVAAVCPAHVNSTDSEVVARKDKYRSERPPSQQRGPVLKIVASTWIELVTNSSLDFLSFQFETPDVVHAKLSLLLESVAKRISDCHTIGIGTIDMSLNDIPPPYGDYLQGTSLALWRADNKLKPTLLKDLQGGELTEFDLLNFVFQGVALPDSFRCMAELSNSVAKDQSELQRLQSRQDEL